VAGRGREGTVVTELLTGTRIGLDVHCGTQECTQFALPLFGQMSAGDYGECAVLELAGTAAWRDAHRTARKRADRAARRGYWFVQVERHARADEIQAINLSMPVRQGRPMSDGYRTPPTSEPLPFYPCARHGVHTYGVETADGTLVAYGWIYRAGDLALVSQILGHVDHLEAEVMYLLVQGIVERESMIGGHLVYNRYDSGTEGLRFFKDRCGFARTQVEWSQW
jgi:hypothetical protein